MPSLTVRPGSNVRLKGQSERVPDFQVIRCEGDRCWIRQKNWDPCVQLPIRITQIEIPDELPALPKDVVGNLVFLNLYRWRKANE